MIILDYIDELNLPNYYIAAGSVFQTIWNYYDNKPLSYGIKNIDNIYYDSNNLSKDNETELDNKIANHFKKMNLNYEFDVHNEARMHLWKKEKELKNRIDDLNERIVNLQNQKNTNDIVVKRIKEIEKILNQPTVIKEFDKRTFDSIVERIVIGEDGNDEKVIRFILKTGIEYKCKENIRIDTSVSFGNYKRFS